MLVPGLRHIISHQTDFRAAVEHRELRQQQYVMFWEPACTWSLPVKIRGKFAKSSVVWDRELEYSGFLHPAVTSLFVVYFGFCWMGDVCNQILSFLNFSFYWWNTSLSWAWSLTELPHAPGTKVTSRLFPVPLVRALFSELVVHIQIYFYFLLVF